MVWICAVVLIARSMALLPWFIFPTGPGESQFLGMISQLLEQCYIITTQPYFPFYTSTLPINVLDCEVPLPLKRIYKCVDNYRGNRQMQLQLLDEVFVNQFAVDMNQSSFLTEMQWWSLDQSHRQMPRCAGACHKQLLLCGRSHV